MDYEAYRRAYFRSPPPKPRFDCAGIRGATLFFADFDAAVEYYTAVLGPPAYVESDDTRGFDVGGTWLTLLKAREGAPRNAEVAFWMKTPEEAEALHRAFVAAGGKGETPSDQLVYEPVRFCPLTDPFGTQLLVVARLPE